MKFGLIPTAEAADAVLVHRLHLGQRVLKKGHLLTPDDVRALQEAGIERVTVARLEAHDMSESEAATAVAQGLRGDGLSVSKPFTGRVNLEARVRGLLVIDAAALGRLNRVDEGVGVATLRPFTTVEPGQMVATVKIIPFAVPRADIERAAAICAQEAPVLRVAAFAKLSAGLLQSSLPGTRAQVLDKTVSVTTKRLKELGCELTRELRCAHDEAAIAGSLKALYRERLDLVLVIGASATADRRDVIPAAIRGAGGAILHFGLPVDPGNLLMLARHEETPVLVLPGSARSPKRSGYDLVLRRLVAGLEVRAEDLTDLGVGGLLAEVEERPQPRRTPAEPASR